MNWGQISAHARVHECECVRLRARARACVCVCVRPSCIVFGGGALLLLIFMFIGDCSFHRVQGKDHDKRLRRS